MKTLENKIYKGIGENGADVATTELIKICTKAPVREGFSIDDVRNRLRIEDACDRAVDCIDLEDADAKNLKAIVAQMRWYKADRAIVDFVDSIEKL